LDLLARVLFCARVSTWSQANGNTADQCLCRVLTAEASFAQPTRHHGSLKCDIRKASGGTAVPVITGQSRLAVANRDGRGCR
jgi:hypothetical protein